MVTEFILTDDDPKNGRPNIAPSAFFHIAQFLEPNSGLLPSLLRLRIIHPDTHFPYLHLLHTPSLKTLEATNVPDHQHPTFFSFLTTLVHKAPLLEDIILGPGRFPLKSLQAILKFTHLHQLELRDAVSNIDFAFFQDVGALPNLESFILDARSCKYISRAQDPERKTPPVKHTEVGSPTPEPRLEVDADGPVGSVRSFSSSPSNQMFGTPKPSSTIDTEGLFWGSPPRPSSPVLRRHEDDDAKVDHPLQPTFEQISGAADFSPSTVGGFYQLKKFHVVGRLSLIQDMISFIASTTLEDISITLIRLSHQDLKQQAETEVEAMLKAEAEAKKKKWIAEEETRRRLSMKGKKYYSRKWSDSLGWQEVIEECDRAEMVRKRTQENFDLRTASYISVLQIVSSRWAAHLKEVRFNQLASSQPLSILPALPKQVYATLFSHPNIEIVEFKQWTLDSVEDFLSALTSSGAEKLKQLHLPIDDPGAAVPLSGLVDIAKACPMLQSLQCCVSTHSPIPEYSIPTSKVLPHGLQTLVVAANNSTSLWDFNQLLLVARHLYLAFPHLQTIDSLELAEQWMHIRDLVKMFQTVRQDDMYRF